MMHRQFQTAHLDIKPDNIFLDGGIPKIGDMGVSKIMNPADDNNPNLPGCGTPAYMPNEALLQSSSGVDSLETLSTLMTTTTSSKYKPPEFPGLLC